MEGVLGLIGAILGVVAALIGRKKIIEHRVGVATAYSQKKSRGKRIVFFLLIAGFPALIMANTNPTNVPDDVRTFVVLLFFAGIGGLFYQITRWFFD